MFIMKKSSNHTVHYFRNHIPALMLEHDMHTIRAWCIQRPNLLTACQATSIVTSQVSIHCPYTIYLWTRESPAGHWRSSHFKISYRIPWKRLANPPEEIHFFSNKVCLPRIVAAIWKFSYFCLWDWSNFYEFFMPNNHVQAHVVAIDPEAFFSYDHKSLFIRQIINLRCILFKSWIIPKKKGF